MHKRVFSFLRTLFLFPLFISVLLLFKPTHDLEETESMTRLSGVLMDQENNTSVPNTKLVFYQGWNHKVAEVYTDAAGQFSLLGMESGSYFLEIEHQHPTWLFAEEIELSTTDHQMSLQILDKAQLYYHTEVMVVGEYTMLNTLPAIEQTVD
ncbi:MAG: carboxypeptidase-like regulatory domain-containing protein [Bacteroidota bacterium]